MQTLPRLSIEADGQPLELRATALVDINIVHRLSTPAACSLTWASDRRTTLPSACTPGSTIRVARQGDRLSLFEGDVTAVEHVCGPTLERQIIVTARDRLERLSHRQPVRAHAGVTVTELARELVADLGIDVETAAAGPLLHRVLQCTQTDLDLLADLTARHGLYFTLRDGTLYVCTLEGIGTPVPLTLGESLLECRVRIDGRWVSDGVAAEGWDPSRVQAHGAQVRAARAPRDRSGVALARRSERDAVYTLTDIALDDDAQAEAVAQGLLDRRTARTVTLAGVAEGDPRLCAGAIVDVEGVSAECDGPYVLTAVTHRLDPRRGLLSEFSTGAPSLPPSTGSARVVWGVVTRTDDPDNRGRVMVTLPAVGDVETGWMPVLSAAAGARKGLVAIPGTGDNVLIVSPNGDLARGVVLGGLYGDHDLPTNQSDGFHRRLTLSTAGGESLTLDDHAGRTRLENGDGSALELGRGGASLRATSDLLIEAPGHTIVIRAKRVDFQEG